MQIYSLQKKDEPPALTSTMPIRPYNHTGNPQQVQKKKQSLHKTNWGEKEQKRDVEKKLASQFSTFQQTLAPLPLKKTGIPNASQMYLGSLAPTYALQELRITQPLLFQTKATEIGTSEVNHGYMFPKVHPRKLTCPLRRDYFNRKYIFQRSILRGYVSFLGSNHPDLGSETQKQYLEGLLEMFIP